MAVRVDGSSGKELEELGTIDGGVLTSRGTGIVIDRAKRRLLVLIPSTQAWSIKELGRTGSGPGEFRWPQALRSVNESTVALFDRSLGRLSYFDVSGAAVSLSRDEPFTQLPDDFCFTRRGMVTLRHDARSRSILHWTNSQGQRQRSAGEPFLKGSPRLERLSNKGLLLCVNESEVVVVASIVKGEIRAYSPAGALLWRLELPDFIPWTFRELAGGGMLLEGQPRGNEIVNHVTVTLLQLDIDRLLVQFGLAVVGKHRSSDLTFESVETRVLRLRDGHVIGRQSDLPVVLALNGTMALVGGGEPAPWVELRRYTLEPR